MYASARNERFQVGDPEDYKSDLTPETKAIFEKLCVACGPLAESNPADRFAGAWSGAMSFTDDPNRMGIHFVKGDLIGDGQVEAMQPEALIYELRNGRLQLVGVEYVVIAEAWDANHETPPTLMGQVFHYVGAPNRYQIPAFYELHVWAWKANSNGMFTDWNPKVSCENYTADAAVDAGSGGRSAHNRKRTR